MTNIKIINFNKKVSFDYNIDHRIECGLVLKGTEVKSARLQGASIQNASCSISGNTIYIYNMNIPTYKKCFQENHDPLRIRSLLIHKKQTKKLIGLIHKNNWQIVPEKLYFNEKNLLKITVVVGKHAKEIDKRQKIKERESVRELKQLKQFQNE
jgi:SsrA-binding protein